MPSTDTIRSKGRAVVVLCIVGLFALAALASAAQGPGAGEKHCPDFGDGLTEFEVDPIADGEHTDGTLHVTIVFDEDTRTFDWTSDIGVDFVFVKGSEDAGSLYTYDPEATSATGLHAPLKESTPDPDDFYSINHVLFCYDTDVAPTESPEPSVSPTDTGTETPEPSVSPTDTGTETPEPSVSPTDTGTDQPEPSVSPTESATVLPTSAKAPPRVLDRALGRSGSDIRTLVWAGVLLVAIGLLSYLAAARAQRQG